MTARRPWAVYACDVGSLRATPSRFAWARLAGDILTVEASPDIYALVEALARDGAEGRDVALGFESPAFLPIPADPGAIFRQREGEGNRSYCGPAGLTVTVMGVQQSAWVLRAVQRAFATHRVTTDWNHWRQTAGSAVLLLWEAFVSGPAKAETHMGDAVTAATAFVEQERDLGAATAVRAETPINLLACAALWAGLAVEADDLRRPTLVLRPARAAPWSLPQA